MSRTSRLIHHSHTGKLRAHEYTSYLPLFIMLAITGLFLTAYTAYAASPGPEASSVSVTGTVPGDPPTQAAVITSPNDGANATDPLIEISGTCPKNTIVYIYKNDIFSGSTVCLDNGTFSIQIDLFIGENVIMAKVYDALDQEGPDSKTITVTYTPAGIQSPALAQLSFDDQLVLNTDAIFKGTFPNQELSVPLSIIGGTAPFAVTIWWGDSNNDIAVHQSNDTLYLTHTFERAGTYQMTIQAKDANNRSAFLSVAAIVNGDPETAITGTTASGSSSPIGQLLALWPMYVGLVVIVIAFWLGELRERRILEPHTPLYRPVHGTTQHS